MIRQRHPGPPFGEHDEGVEQPEIVLGGRGQVTAYRAELAAAAQSAQAARYFLLQLGHADVAFTAVVIRRRPPVPGEPQVVVLPVAQAAGQRVVLFISGPERAAVWLAPASTAERYRLIWETSAAGSTTSRPWLAASRTRSCMAVSASAACAAQHHWPPGAASVTACSSRKAWAQHNW